MVTSSDTGTSHLVLSPDLHCVRLDGLRAWGYTSHLSYLHLSCLKEVEMRSVNSGGQVAVLDLASHSQMSLGDGGF